MKTPVLFSIVLTIHGLAIGSFLLMQGCTTRSGIGARSGSSGTPSAVATASDASGTTNAREVRSLNRTRSAMGGETVASTGGAITETRTVRTVSAAPQVRSSSASAGRVQLPPRRGASVSGVQQSTVSTSSSARNNIGNRNDVGNGRATSWTPPAASVPPVTTRPISSSPRVGSSASRTISSNSTEGSTVYVIQKGDVLSRIANKNGLSTKELAEFNSLATPDSIKVGQKILLPAHAKAGGSPRRAATSVAAVQPKAPSTPAKAAPSGSQSYTVRKGDSLSLIAYRYGTTVSSLRAANQMSGDQIKVGEVLTIAGATKSPAGSGVAKATPVSKPTPKPAPVNVPPVTVRAPSANATGYEKVTDVAIPTKNSTRTDVVVNPPASVPPAVTVPATQPKKTPPAVVVPPVTVGTPRGISVPAVPPVVDPKIEQAFEYVVQDGESIEDIARAFIVSEDDVRKLNKLGNGEKVRPGQTLKIPPSIF